MTLYEPYEVDYSYKSLLAIVKALDFPVCIIGGWAVYYTVNEHFEQEQGRAYLGSKDIDIGFFINKALAQDELKRTQFGEFIELLEELGFQPSTFRYYRDVHIETGEYLTPEESRKTPSHNICRIYIDPIVNYVHPCFRDVFGFSPIDEPLISAVFEDENNRVELKEFNGLVLLPKPEILLATKIKTAPTRTIDEKLIKDVCDMYAVSWYSGEDFRDIRNKTQRVIDFMRYDVRSLLSDDLLSRVETALGISKETVKSVIEALYK